MEGPLSMSSLQVDCAGVVGDEGCVCPVVESWSLVASRVVTAVVARSRCPSRLIVVVNARRRTRCRWDRLDRRVVVSDREEWWCLVFGLMAVCGLVGKSARLVSWPSNGTQRWRWLL